MADFDFAILIFATTFWDASRYDDDRMRDSSDSDSATDSEVRVDTSLVHEVDGFTSGSHGLGGHGTASGASLSGLG